MIRAAAPFMPTTRVVSVSVIQMKDDTAEVLSIDGREVRVTHPDKPYFSKQTKLSKLDLVPYYLSVAPGALAGISIVRSSQALRRS